MKITLPCSTGGKIEDGYVFLTRRIRITPNDILSISPTYDGEGATVVTARGAMRVCEDYNALLSALYGADARKEVRNA